MDRLRYTIMFALIVLITGQAQALPNKPILQLDQKLYTHLDGYWAKGMQFSNLQLENYELYPIESSAYPALEADKILRLGAVSGIDYLQVVRGSQLDLVRCDDQACSTIKEQALDLAAVKKGFATHALGSDGTIVTWYQQQQNMALTLSVFPINGEEKVIHQGDEGIITAVQQGDTLRAIGTLKDLAVIWQFNSGYQATLLTFPTLYSSDIDLLNLLPIAIGNGEQPKVVLVSESKDSSIGELYLCDFRGDANNDGIADCEGGIRSLGITANPATRWIIEGDDLYGNRFSDENNLADPQAVKINLADSSVMSLSQSVAGTEDYEKYYWFQGLNEFGDLLYTTRSKDLGQDNKYDYQSNIVFADKDADGLGDSWQAYWKMTVRNTAEDDYERDGLTNLQEFLNNTNPKHPDTDGDDIPDAFEVTSILDPRNTADALEDYDSDGLTNLQEYTLTTNLESNDTDGDGVLDPQEAFTDSDRDRKNDAVESSIIDFDQDGFTAQYDYYDDNNCFPNTRLDVCDLDRDGILNKDDSDDDGDGMPDSYETAHGLNAWNYNKNFDTDDDGINDYLEYQIGTHPRRKDTDNDGMWDGYEYHAGLLPLDYLDAAWDKDQDGASNLEEFENQTDAADPDSKPFDQPWMYATNGSMSAFSPALDDEENLYITSQSGHLYALTSEGLPLWATPSVAFGNAGFTPVLAPDDKIVGMVGRTLYQINRDGTNKVELKTFNSNGYYGVAINQQGDYIVAGYNKVYGLTHTGESLWEYKLQGQIRSNTAPVIDRDGVIYIYDSARQLTALTADGQLKWKKTLSYRPTQGVGLVLDQQGNIYVAANRYLDVYNSVGDMQWRISAYSTITVTPVINEDGTIYIGSSRYLESYQIGGLLNWRHDVGNTITGSPAIDARGSIYVPTRNKLLVLDNERNQISSITVDLSRYNGGDPILGKSGTLYLGSSANKVQAIRVSNKGLISSNWGRKYHSSSNTSSVCYFEDTDCDGIYDAAEIAFGTDPDVADALADNDGDGLSNKLEILFGTDISVMDTDLDTMSDAYEAAFNLNPLSDDSQIDADDDGYSNVEEFLAGTDPNDETAKPSTEFGSLLWKQSHIKQVQELAIDDDGIMYRRSGNSISAQTPNGLPLWNAAFSGVQQGPLLVDKKQLLVVSTSGLHVLDSQTGSLNWHYAGNYSKAAVDGDGSVYAINSNGELVKVSVIGDLVWALTPEYSKKFYTAISPVITADGNVYLIGSYNGYSVVAINSSGEELWRSGIGRDKPSPLAVDLQGNIVFSSSNDIYKYGANGQRIWYQSTSPNPNNALASVIGNDGSIYTVLSNSTVLKSDAASNSMWQATVRYAYAAPVLDDEDNLIVSSSNAIFTISPEGEASSIAVSGVGAISSMRMWKGRLYVAGSGLYSLYSGTSENTFAWSGASGGNSNAHNSCVLGDADCDGLPDSYEIEHGLDMNVYNRNDDQDRDGLSDYEEYLAGTNVNDSDSDNDKLLDGYEGQFGMDPLLDDAATSDIDDDGYSDLLEFEAGTDPTDPLALPSQDLGSLKWNVEPNATTVPVIDSSDVLYFGTDYGLVAYSNKGSKIWSLNLYGAVNSTPVLGQQDDIYVIRGSSIYSVNSITGGIKWSSEFSTNALLSAIGGNGNIYLLEGANVHALDSVTGEIIWSYTHTRALLPALTVGKNGDVYISDSNYFYALTSLGSLRWTNMTAGYLNKSPIVTEDGKIIAVSTSRRQFYGLSEGGDLLWNTSLYYPNDHELVMADNGNVLIYNRGSLRSYSSDSGYYLNQVSGWYSSTRTGPVVASNGLTYSIEYNYLRIYDNTGALVEQVSATAAKAGGYSIKMGADGSLYYLTDNGLRAIYSPASGLSELSAWPTQGKGNFNRSNATCTKDDSDCDGLPDAYESIYGLNPLSANDAITDLDDDGFNNLAEFKDGTDPTNPFSNNDCFVGDSDCDGMPDEWENRYGLDMYNPEDALQDLDLDTFINKQEFLDKTDPANRYSNASCDVNDSDCDGMLDRWEVQYGLNPLDPSDRNEDPDQDGFDNLEEHNNGTDPLTASSDSSCNQDDLDCDGMPDAFEEKYSFLSKQNPQDAHLDHDGDGYSNIKEYELGSDLMDYNSPGIEDAILECELNSRQECN